MDNLLLRGLRDVTAARFADPRSNQGYTVFTDFAQALTTPVQNAMLYALLVRINENPLNDDWMAAGPTHPDVLNLFQPRQVW